MSDTWTYFDEKDGRIVRIYDKEPVKEEIRKKLFVGVFNLLILPALEMFGECF